MRSCVLSRLGSTLSNATLVVAVVALIAAACVSIDSPEGRSPPSSAATSDVDPLLNQPGLAQAPTAVEVEAVGTGRAIDITVTASVPIVDNDDLVTQMAVLVTSPVRIDAVDTMPARVRIEIEYNAASVHDPEMLLLAFYDPASRTWIPVASTVDTERNIVSAEVDHLSLWAVFEGLAEKIQDWTIRLGNSLLTGRALIELPTCERDPPPRALVELISGLRGSPVGICVEGTDTAVIVKMVNLRSYPISVDVAGSAGYTVRRSDAPSRVTELLVNRIDDQLGDGFHIAGGSAVEIAIDRTAEEQRLVLDGAVAWRLVILEWLLLIVDAAVGNMANSAKSDLVASALGAGGCLQEALFGTVTWPGLLLLLKGCLTAHAPLLARRGLKSLAYWVGLVSVTLRTGLVAGMESDAAFDDLIEADPLARVNVTVLPISSGPPPEVMSDETTEEPPTQDVPTGDTAPRIEEALPDSPASPPASASTTSWTHVRHDAQRSGYAVDENVLRPPLKVAWKVGNITSVSPVVSEGRVITRTGSTMTARNVDGSVAWTSEPAGRPVASDEQRVYIASVGHVVARTLETGAQLWDDRWTGIPGGGFPVALEGTLLTGNRVLDASTGDVVGRLAAMRCFNRRRASQGSLVYAVSSRSLYACNLKEEIIWEQDVGGASLWPVVAGEMVYVYGSGGITALDRNTGAVITRRLVPARVRVPFAADGDFIYVADDDRTVAAYTADGLDLVWGVKVEGRPVSPITVANGYVYLVTSIRTGKSLLVALDTATGEQTQSYQLAYSTNFDSPEPVVDSGRLWLVSDGCSSNCTLTVFESEG